MNFRPLQLTALCILFAVGSVAAADERAEVNRLLRQGQAAAALQQADVFLSAHPRDAQMRFLKAIALGDLGRRVEAVRVLQGLTEDFPALAEPHNNLATLHAAAGEYAKARSSLEEALRLDPGYATAHENLGDVQAALAAQSYATALRLAPGRSHLEAKIALVRQLARSTTLATPSSAAPAARTP